MRYLQLTFILFFYSISLFSSAQQPKTISIIAANTDEIYQALSVAKRRGGYTQILLKDSTYQLPRTLVISVPSVYIGSLSGQKERVILTGNGMQNTPQVDNLIYVAAPHFTLEGITLQQSGNHLVQVSGQDNADYFTMKHCILRDAYEQLLKVSNGGEISADYGVVENCTFEYSAGIGPQYYIGGIDAHGSKYWHITKNIFKDISSPSYHIAEHAIHFWNRSSQNIIENNIILNCDRGIGFGMGDKGNTGGTIKNNTIVHTKPLNPFADVGIILENSPNTLITNNRIYLSHSYKNAIEYRFQSTKGVIISQNITNKAIAARDGATALINKNAVNQSKEVVLDIPISVSETEIFK